MNLAIVHHHLNRGGVTQVILSHLRALHEADALKDFERIVVFHGGRITGWPTEAEPALARVELEGVASIDYDNVVDVAKDAPYNDMSAALSRRDLPAESTILHVHNHTLGKNAAWPGALARLAEDGYRMLLQLHDFAEDFRPDNYRHQVEFYGGKGMTEVYFQAPHVQYAVLNSRDRNILLGAGFQEDHLAWLPNPVHTFPPLPHKADARQKLRERCGVPESDWFVLYPVRGIRRKNVGELVLWSALSPRPTTFAVTLAPVNPVERPAYDAWQAFAEERDLPCKFDVGGEAGLTFHENLAAADAIINTSVAEGFGLVFLEAWLTDNLLIGRDLPEISADFKNAGLRLDSLAPALWIPRRSPLSDRTVFSEQRYREQMAELFRGIVTSFGLDDSLMDSFDTQMDARLADDWIDFALLTTQAQREVIDSILNERELAEMIVQENAQVMRPLTEPNAKLTGLIEGNAQIVLQRFSLRGTGETLRQQYSQLMKQTPGAVSPLANAEAILRQFVDLSRLHPVRLETV